jgi:heme/copper-type cytochrome/quinol oxidase subunit 4
VLFIASINLTLITIWFILKRVKSKKVNIGKLMYRQSHIHEIVKNLIPKDLTNKPNKVSQSRKHIEKNMIRVIMLDGMAYWVSENIFYVSETVNGDPDLDTARPVDTLSMSKEEIKKMLSILDSLKSGVSDERGSAGNT